MRKITAVLASLVCALALGGTASGASFGVAEDATKYAEDGGATYFGLLGSLGMHQNRVTVLWDPAAPTAVAEKAFLDRSLPVAAARGVRVIFAVYPTKARAFADSPAAAGQFCDWVAGLARAYPQVQDFVVGNEPNQPRFLQPQFDGGGQGASAALFEPVLAACYDALKGVSPAINVIGLGLSPRGNDDAGASSNVSTSPVRFLRDLGAAYRASGRTAPLMDELGFHAYPNANADPLAKGYQWPNAGATNLDRVKQAFWDAFNGTGQPVIGEGSTRLVLDEVGWQTASPQGFYTGSENVAAVDEATQAQIYAALVAQLDCDASVDMVNFFHLVDETDRDRFQSGLFYADDSPKAAAGAVQSAVARGGCAGAAVAWQHAAGVLGAAVEFGKPTTRSRKQRAWGFTPTASEDATYKAGVFAVRNGRLPTSQVARTLLAGGPQIVLASTGLVKAYYSPLVRFPLRALKPGAYVYGITLRAAMNPSRTATFVSAPFRVR